MEKQIITERLIDIIRKIIEMNYEDIIYSSDKIIEKKINRGIDDFTCRYTYPINKNVSLFISIYPIEHKISCDNYISESDNLISDYCDSCVRAYGYKMIFTIIYNEGLNIYIESFGMKTRYKNGTDIMNNTWKDCIHAMESSFKVSTHFFCKCGDLCAYKNGKRYDMCSNCYIHSYVRSEDCCICLENGGCWVQLRCNHIIHIHCWNKILKQGPLCPLCRSVTSVENMNPYN